MHYVAHGWKKAKLGWVKHLNTYKLCSHQQTIRVVVHFHNNPIYFWSGERKYPIYTQTNQTGAVF